MAELDVTDQVRTALAEALAGGRSRVLLVVSASSCPGCDQLAHQLARPEVVRLLDERATLLTVSTSSRT